MSNPLRVVVVEPQPLLAQRVRALVERAGAAPVGPDDDHDLALVCADAGSTDWAWTVDHWTNGPTPVVLTRLRPDGEFAAGIGSIASIPRPFAASELEAVFAEVREVLAAGGSAPDPNPTQPVPADLRPEIGASHSVDAADDAAGATDDSDETSAVEVLADVATAVDAESSTAAPPPVPARALQQRETFDLRRWAEAGAGLVDVWASLNGPDRVDAVERYLRQVVEASTATDEGSTADTTDASAE